MVCSTWNDEFWLESYSFVVAVVYMKQKKKDTWFVLDFFNYFYYLNLNKLKKEKYFFSNDK